MKKKQEAELMNNKEAVRLFEYATLGDLLRAKELYRSWREINKNEQDLNYVFVSALGFIYNTGRLQGIKDERAKKNKF